MEVKNFFLKINLLRMKRCYSILICRLERILLRILRKKIQDWIINLSRKLAKYTYKSNNEVSNKYKNVSNNTSNIYDSNVSIDDFCKDLELSHFIKILFFIFIIKNLKTIKK